MKILFLFALVAFAAASTDYYTTADDDLDVEAVVADIDRFYRYVNCFMDRAPCSERAASYRKIIPDSIETGCTRCNNAQKRLANQFLKGIREVLPHEYINFRQKFDPEGKYLDDFVKIVDGY